MAVSKDLRGGSVKKALHKAEKANKNPNAKKAVNAKKTTSLKATAVKPARFNRGVAGVAVASTLAMMLPSAAASALQINQQNIVDSANVVSKAGKGNLRSQELNMLRWGVGARRESRQTKAFVEIARRAIEAQKQRENVENVQNTQPAISSEDFNGDKSATPTKTSEIKNTTSDSKANVTSSENTASATESANPPASAQSSESAKAKQPEVKPVDTPAVNQPVQPTTKPESAPTAKQDATKPAEVKQPEVNAGDVNTAENKQPVASQPVNAESSKPASEQNTNAQSASAHAENTNTVSNANTPNGRVRRSVGSDGASNGSSVPTTTTSAPASPAASSANNAPTSTAAVPAGNTPAQSTPVTPASAESNAGAGTTASTSADTTAQDNRQKQSAESSTQGTQGSAQGSAQGSQSSAEGATTGATGEDKSATPSATAPNTASEPGSASSNNPTPSPASTSTPNAGTPTAGTATNNTATDPNSQVIKPNTDNPTADSTDKANEQVQTDKKPNVTYNLQIRYTIGGAANKQLVQPYELTIDKKFFDKLDKEENYQYIELPQSAGYSPSVYHSGDYQYYVKKDDKFVIDDGTDANAKRYLRLNKDLIKEYAVKRRQAVESNNSAQASQSDSDDGIQYYGELNINYAPKTAKYYVRHLVQDLKDKDKFEEAPNIGKAIVVEHKIKGDDGNVTTTKEVIHVTEITGTVGSDVTAISTYIPGYEPEHNLISSPLSDSEDEKDKLVLNLRYYRKAYEVTYDSAGGTDVTAQKVYYDQEVPSVPEPTYRGHTFLGWKVVKLGDSSSSGPLIKGTRTDYKMPDHNVQFRAVWSANAATSYRVNVWVQKADLVDKEHPDSLANYDFVGLVERRNVQTDSDVALDNMDDAGVAKDTSKLNGKSVDDYVENPELGLTREELQGKDSDHKDGLISKFNWMNDTPVTSLEGYDTEHPGDASNKGKDLFTRYFHVNKDLTKKLNTEQHDFVQGRPDLGKRSKSQLCADDLNNTLNLVYDRNTYELIFAKPAGVGRGNNAAIKREDKNGKTTIYCYAGGGNCSDKYDSENKDEKGNTINHKGYRVNVRYGQSLTDIWPDVNELDFNEDAGSLGWQIGFAGGVKYRDTPPYRFTKEEFADPSWRVVGEKQAPKISDNPDSDPNNTHELKDNQRLLTADSNKDQVIPIQVIIEKQSISSAKSGNDPGNDDYVLSTDSYSKDDTSSEGYDHKSSSIAGFNSVDKEGRIELHDNGDFDDDILPELYPHSIEYEKNGEKDWDDLDDGAKEAFKKKYHVGFRNHLAGVSEDSEEKDENGYLVFKYKRQKYAVQFYNADGNAITKDNVAATEELPFEYSLTKRGKKDLTGEDKDLYGNYTSYDASVTKDGAGDTSKQFDGKYTFTLNGTKYSIVRPNNLPKDYVFKGWALDQAGTRFINGEDKDITMPVNGIKLYAAWGLPTDIKHTVTLDYNMPETDENGKEIAGTKVVKEKQFDRYQSIDEKNDIKVPTRKGYDFYGWELAKKGNDVVAANTPYAFGNKIVEDITLRAVWVQDTRYNGTFKHIFLKPGYTFADYKKVGLTDAQKAAMVDHVSTQTVSGLREHLRYNAEAVYSDETHFPDKHFTSFEASSHEEQNTGEFVYQTYNTRKYKVRYVTIGKDGKEKDLLPESEVSSVNRKYDVAFYKPIEGFMPRITQKSFTYTTDDDGKQTSDKEITFTYDDVRVLKRNDDKQARPDHYTRYVFKVADGKGSMGSVVDWQNKDVADGSALVYDAIKGTKAYQMPLPTVKAKPGFEFAGWTSKIGSYGAGLHTLEYADGADRLPIRSEEQNSPEVIYTANFKLKAPVAAAPQVLKPTTEDISTTSSDAKKLITNAGEYPTGATFSFADGATFDKTPGLHKIKVQVALNGNTAQAEVLYRVLPDLVYASDWDKFKATEYGSKHEQEYAPITFTGSNDEGTIIGHDTTDTTHPAGGTTTLTAYVYKDKDVRVNVPQAFGMDHSKDNYHYVFKGWTTSAETDPAKITKYDIDSESRYKDITVNVDSGKTYTAVYKKIEYFSSSSDNGTVPKDSVVAIFKPAAGRKWKDGTDGPKVFYIKKGANLADITVQVTSSDGTTTDEKALTFLQNNLTNPTGKWSRSSMINGKEEVKPIGDVSNWKVNEPFQEFVAGQTPWTQPEVQTDYLVAVQDKRDTLPTFDKYLTNLADLKKDAETKGEIKDVTIEYDLPKGKKPEDFENKMLKKPSLYTVPLRITVNYKDGAKPETYKRVARLKVIYQLMYDKSLPKLDSTQPVPQPGSTNPLTGVAAERDLVLNKNEYVKVNFRNADQVDNKDQGSLDENATKLYYVLKKVADDENSGVAGVKAPQAVGKDYDADGYHYVFKGWRKLNSFVDNDNSNVDVQNADGEKLLSNDDIRKLKYSENTTYQAVYEKVNNVIDAKSKDKIPDNYVPYVFLPAFGRKWDDGSYKPKVIYFKSDSTTYENDVNNKTNELHKRLKGFSKWEVYDAGNNPVPLTDTNENRQIRVFVANQIADMPVNVSQFVRSVGDEVPSPIELVPGVDSNNLDIAGMHGAGVVYSSGANSVRIAKPGITTAVVNVTHTDDSGKPVTVPVKVPIHVLPNVIARQDLPAAGTIEDEFISKNYTKFTYVTDPNGKMMSNVHTYWVRKGKESAIKDYIPDVLANAGYVFKDWTTVSNSLVINPNDSHEKATAGQREALAKIAELCGKNYLARIIRGSKNSTLAALKNLLLETKPSEYMQYAASREKLAQIAQDSGKSFVANIIRNSKKSSIAALENLLAEAGVKDARIVLPNVETDTIIVANFEKMDPVEFKFSGKAIEGVPATFTLANLTRGVLKADGTTDTNATVSVDGKPFTVNALSSNSLNQLGISHSCTGTSCTISGTPKIVDGKKVVELTFTSVDKYGREARVTVDIEVIPENKPTPVPSPSPTPQPQPAPQPPLVIPSAPSAPVLPFDVCECNDSESCAAPKPETKEPAKPAHSLAKTGSNVAQSAILASLLASVGLAGFAAKHRRKREDKE